MKNVLSSQFFERLTIRYKLSVWVTLTVNITEGVGGVGTDVVLITAPSLHLHVQSLLKPSPQLLQLGTPLLHQYPVLLFLLQLPLQSLPQFALP